MKFLSKTISFILCVLIVFSIIPSYATNEKFISYNIQTIDEFGSISQINEVAYYDGNELFVTINFLSKYTLFYYDENNATFVRKGQEKSSKFGSVSLNISDKKATVYMNPFSKKEYTLDNIYQFGSQIFLPLAQMSSFLKASLSIKNDTMRIVNSGYSLADADYAMSKISGNKSIVNYCIDDVINDIYGGSETAYYYSSVLGYFGSTIFGLRLSKLDFITNLGDYKEYESFLDKCVTNNKTYIEALTTNDDLINRFNKTHNFNKDINDLSNDMKDVTSLVKDIAEPLKDSSLSNALLWTDAKDWNALFDTISTVTNISDYYLKLGSMCVDNKNMIDQLESNSSVSKNGLPVHLAIESVQKRYGQNLVNNVMSEIGQELVDKAISNGKKVVLKQVIPSTAAISIVSKVFKYMGFDIASDLDYSIMIDLNTKYMLLNNYSYQESVLSHKNARQTERYRLSAVFYLQACEQTYCSANKLAAKNNISKSYYNDAINKIDNVLSIYYLAAQSKRFDNFEDIDKNINNNRKEISDGGLIDYSVEISMEDALSMLHKSDEYNQDKVKSALVDLMYNLPKHGYEFNDTSIGFEIIDLDGDDIPEFIYCTYYGATHIPQIDGVYKYRNGTYTKCNVDFKDGGNEFPIVPKKNSEGKQFFFSSLDSVNDLVNPPTFASFWYYHSTYVYEFSLSNDILTSKMLSDYTKYRDAIDGNLDENSCKKAWAEYKKEISKFNNEYSIDNSYKTLIIQNLFMEYIDSELPVAEQLEVYHKIVNEAQINVIAEMYFNEIDGFKEIQFEDIRYGYGE